MSGEEKFRLIITVKRVRGHCPVFEVGDRIVVECPEVVVEKTSSICVHALGSMLSMIVPLSRGISFKQLGLATVEGEKGYVQCLDPGKPYTEGGTVLFEVERERM